MDARLFLQMLSDKSFSDLKKLQYKYPAANMAEFIELLKLSHYKHLALKDFSGKELVYIQGLLSCQSLPVKRLMSSGFSGSYGMEAMENEIAATLSIESIDFSRDSVRKILRGYAPVDESEKRIYGLKLGLEYIADPQNVIRESSISELYHLAIHPYVSGEDRLLPGNRYRHDDVFIVGQALEHTGLPANKLPEYMSGLVSFIHAQSELDDLCKAAVIHFYIAYLHPWFDGNGRMARLLHMWYLRQQGWSAAMFIPFSSYIERSRKAYYHAFSLCENNTKISGLMDISPFVQYFIQNVYHRLEGSLPKAATTERFTAALGSGIVTEKEKELWGFVLSAYGIGEFSTKQLERDFGNAAYATIRSFVLKFEGLELLVSTKYGNRVKYRVKA